jgi:hypothetical protein
LTEQPICLRSAQRQLPYVDDVEVMGFKRIVGSFTEASAYAFATLGCSPLPASFGCAEFIRGSPPDCGPVAGCAFGVDIFHRLCQPGLTARGGI